MVIIQELFGGLQQDTDSGSNNTYPCKFCSALTWAAEIMSVRCLVYVLLEKQQNRMPHKIRESISFKGADHKCLPLHINEHTQTHTLSITLKWGHAQFPW